MRGLYISHLKDVSHLKDISHLEDNAHSKLSMGSMY